ncbi:DUF6160 family protein [Halospina sp. K52047b]|uniref:DUF6160 family protein n=1 Tax=Halospina sp. K52047b TaxID=2614160 RepID=UPI00124A9C34|nr:DUF6160 family protein [Halospina sp. K52047b]KAA8984563.1 hypothetical protein F3089_04245 [Halospina sp. K52047b]
MMTMKKSLLALSVAAMPMAASADLQPMNDNEMGGVTGQAGVTIELSTAATIGAIEYNQDTADSSTGSVLMEGIRVGGHEDGEKLEVDVYVDLVNDAGTISNAVGGAPDDANLEDGDAVINVRNLGNELAPVEVGVDMDSLGLMSSDGTITDPGSADSSATLISNLDLDMYVSKLNITAKTDNIVGADNSIGSLRIENDFAAELSADFDVAAVSLVDARMGGAGSMELLKTANEEDFATQVGLLNPVNVVLEVGQGPAISAGKQSTSAPEETLRVNIAELSADMWLPTINVGSGGDDGNASIGSVGISNLNVVDTQMAVYGRE